MSGSKIGIFKMSASAIAVLLCASFTLAHESEEMHNSIGMVFVHIPAGEFMMGTAGARPQERPVRRVTISQSFYLGKYEVTQGQWQAVMGSNPSHFTGDPNRPVEKVSWNDVQEFIKRLNGREGIGEIYRLPTEAEWEYAARAGTTTVYHFDINFDTTFDEIFARFGQYAWYDHNAKEMTHPVGQLLPNPWGLYDMYGNVMEWVQDWYGDYLEGDVTDPTGPSSGERRGVRGGSWSQQSEWLRSAARLARAPGFRRDFLGFRLLRMSEYVPLKPLPLNPDPDPLNNESTVSDD